MGRIAVNLSPVQLFLQSGLLIRLIGVQLARGLALAEMNYSSTHACPRRGLPCRGNLRLSTRINTSHGHREIYERTSRTAS